MEIASTSMALHMFPTEQRSKIKHINFSEIPSRSYRDRKEDEKYDLMPAPKKRNKLSEEEPNKRQKKTTIAKPVPERSTTLPRIRLRHETKAKPKVTITKPNEEGPRSLRDLLAKAKNKVEEKKKIDGRREYIARQRLLARLAINRIVPTVVADDHLKYHIELEQLGCTFIRDQVNCLRKFVFKSRDGYYNDGYSTSSVFEKETESLRSDGERKHGSSESSTNI